MDFQFSEDGSLPSFAWPGGYPLYYIDEDNNVLSAEAANKVLSEGGKIVAQEVHLEGSPLICDQSGAEIQSAYGIPEESDL